MQPKLFCSAISTVCFDRSSCTHSGGAGNAAASGPAAAGSAGGGGDGRVGGGVGRIGGGGGGGAGAATCETASEGAPRGESQTSPSQVATSSRAHTAGIRGRGSGRSISPPTSMSQAWIPSAARHSPGLDGRKRDHNDKARCVKGSPAPGSDQNRKLR